MATVNWTNEAYRNGPGALRDFVLRAVAEVLFWGVMLQLITGLYLQSQMVLFDRIVIPNGFSKALLALGLMVLAAASLFLHRGNVALRPCLLPAGVFACYLAADLAWLIATSRLPLSAILFGINKYFLFFAVLPAAALLKPRISPRQLNFRLMLLLVPCIAMALAQFAMNDPLLPTAAEDNSFEIPAVEFFGRTRAFSLFRGVPEFGQTLAFFAALLIAQLVAKPQRNRLATGLLLLLTTVACLATFRRGAYLEYAAAALAAVAIAGRWRMTRALPWIFLTMAIALVGAGALLGSSHAEGMLSSSSLGERLDAWRLALDTWLARPDASILFGTGLSQTSLMGTGLSQIESQQLDYFLVDNGFLAVTVQLGLVGLVLWFWVMHSLWRDMLATAWQTGGSLAIAVSALLSTWMMRDVFDPMFALYPLYAFLVFWSLPSPTPKFVTSPQSGQEPQCP